MEQKSENRNATVLLSLIALSGWFAIVVQFYLFLNNGGHSFAETTIRFFTFFTILTNILVSLCCSSLLLFPDSRLGKHFSSAQTLTAIAVYIVIVGLIYNTILRFLWQPQGMQRIVDELLHSLVPVLFLIYWLTFVPKRGLKWNDFWIWLVYPLVYLIVVMVRGNFSDYYPYPFLDLGKLETTVVIFNCVGITFLFVLFSLLFIGIGKLISKDKNAL